MHHSTTGLVLPVAHAENSRETHAGAIARTVVTTDISAPGMPSDDLEMDLEEIHELEHTPHGRTSPGRAFETTAPEPVFQPEAGTTEVEVPIDIEIAPGTTRVSLNVRLILNLNKR